jgi:hypothetical protein
MRIPRLSSSRIDWLDIAERSYFTLAGIVLIAFVVVTIVKVVSSLS